MQTKATVTALVVLTISTPMTMGFQQPEAPLDAAAPDLGQVLPPLPQPPELPRPGLSVTRLDVPLLVDEVGDVMTGDLAFEAASGVAFPGGRLVGSPALRYGDMDVCLANVEHAACGDITSIRPGAGLAGGGAKGDVVLGIPIGGIVTTMISPGAVSSSAIRDDTVGSVDIRDRTIVARDVDAASVQVRVAGTCPEGSSIRAVADDGAVTCEPDDGGGSGNFDELRVTGGSRFDGSLNMSDSVLCDGCVPAPLTIGPRDRTGVLQPYSSGLTGHSMEYAVGSDGLPAVAFTADRGLAFAHCHDASCATSTLRTLDATSDWASLAIGADGFPVVAHTSHYTSSSPGLKVTHCLDVACASATTEVVSSAGASGGWVGLRIVIGSDGFPLIAQSDPGPGVGVVHCLDAACATSTTHTVDPGAFAYESNIGLAVAADGFPIISYVDGFYYGPFPSDVRGPRDLKVAHCHDLACTSSTNRTVDAGVIHNDTSIAVGVDGRAVVSYFDAARGDLVLAQCNDAGCSSSTRMVLDASGTVGMFNHIAIGGDGNPVLSYLDFGRGTKLARCGDPACTTSMKHLATPFITWMNALGVDAGGRPILVGISTGGSAGMVVLSGDLGGGKLVARSPGGFQLFTTDDLSVGVELPAGSGSWTAFSDRAAKTGIVPVEPRSVLAALDEVPLYSWSYSAQGPGIRHLGPMAQDFHGAFGLGEDDRHISQVDADGVALAAIQGLWQELQQERARNDDLEARLAALEAALKGT